MWWFQLKNMNTIYRMHARSTETNEQSKKCKVRFTDQNVSFRSQHSFCCQILERRRGIFILICQRVQPVRSGRSYRIMSVSPRGERNISSSHATKSRPCTKSQVVSSRVNAPFVWTTKSRPAFSPITVETPTKVKL